MYSPTLAKKDYESRTLGHVMGRLFESTPVALVARLINDHELSEQEIAELKQLLDSRTGSPPGKSQDKPKNSPKKKGGK